jgi:hypothetical protein
MSHFSADRLDEQAGVAGGRGGLEMEVADAVKGAASDRQLGEGLAIESDFDLRACFSGLPSESQGVPLLRLEFAS